MPFISTLQFCAPPPAFDLPTLIKSAIEAYEAMRDDQAWQLAQQIVGRVPDQPDALSLLGLILLRRQRREEALQMLQKAVAHHPHDPNCLNNLSVLYYEVDRLEESVAAAKEAARYSPQLKEAWFNLARALHKLKRFEEARDTLLRAVEIAPEHVPVVSLLGQVWWELENEPEATACFRRARDLAPDNPDCWNNLGFALNHGAQLEEAITCFEHGLAVAPERSDIRTNLAYSLLLQGNFQRGLPYYESRPERPRGRPEKLWEGGELHGRHLMLLCEQGFGDSLQFSRFFAEVQRRGGPGLYSVATHPEVMSLLSTNLPDCEIISGDGQIPEVDTWYPLVSLPLLFGLTLETIPAPIPYLHAAPAKAAAWRKRLAGDDRLRIGVAWGGRPTHPNDRYRSIAFDALATLFAFPCSFYSLQKGPRAREAQGSPVIDYSEELHDFSDTAGLIANLDLVISIDTAIIHLAGAMGKPVWVLLPGVPDWRWLRYGSTTNWYPNLRLFRQMEKGRWNEVLEEVYASLTEYLAAHPAPAH